MLREDRIFGVYTVADEGIVVQVNKGMARLLNERTVTKPWQQGKVTEGQ